MLPRIPATLVATLATALLATACAAPRDLDLTLQHASAQGKFMVGLQPPAAAPAINQMHAWQLRVTTPDGTPVTHASVNVDGGMPQHGHGLPTRPRVTHELGPGIYALEGMKFTMTGWWDLRLTIAANGVADTAVFNLVLTESGLQQPVAP